MVCRSRLLVALGASLIIPALMLGKSVADDGRSPSPPQPALTTQPLPETAVEYQQLQSLLAVQDWQAADQETRRILQQWVHPTGDIYGAPLPQTIPVDAIQTLERLWGNASHGQFGLGVQQRIWQEIVAQHPNDLHAAVKAFGDRVGWTRPTPDPENFTSPDWLTEPELNFSTHAPQGHLPWTGISWETISNILNQQSCGSCSIDVLYLQGERFQRYLPGLYDRVRLALNPMATVSQVSWQNPQLRYELDLKTLYPNSACRSTR